MGFERSSSDFLFTGLLFDPFKLFNLDSATLPSGGIAGDVDRRDISKWLLDVQLESHKMQGSFQLDSNGEPIPGTFDVALDSNGEIIFDGARVKRQDFDVSFEASMVGSDPAKLNVSGSLDSCEDHMGEEGTKFYLVVNAIWCGEGDDIDMKNPTRGTFDGNMTDPVSNDLVFTGEDADDILEDDGITVKEPKKVTFAGQ